MTPLHRDNSGNSAHTAMVTVTARRDYSLQEDQMLLVLWRPLPASFGGDAGALPNRPLAELLEADNRLDRNAKVRVMMVRAPSCATRRKARPTARSARRRWRCSLRC